MGVERHPLLDPRAARGVRADQDLLDRLERSAALLGDCAISVVPRFYERLFRRCPELRHLFSSDPARQQAQNAKVGASIAAVVVHLRNPAALAGPLRELGARHAGYGAKAEHYPIVVEELVAAMAEAGGGEWTADDTADWRTAMMIVAGIMMEGSRTRSMERTH